MRLDTPPVSFKTLVDEMNRMKRAMELLRDSIVATSGYRSWTKTRAIAHGEGIDPVDLWWAVKFRRSASVRSLRLKQMSGDAFLLTSSNELMEPLHRLDRAARGGGTSAWEPDHGIMADREQRKRLRIQTLREEAAESSIMEGAARTREQAVEMLRENRTPRDGHELMIRNNYVAMEQIKGWLGRELSPEMLCELQQILTEGTLKSRDQEGRFRRSDERVFVEDKSTGESIFDTPPAEQLKRRVDELCAFANREHKDEEFLHPIVKASILHFMVGYEHPFVDGNGRTARAVFYWYALRQGYGVFEYMPISERIRAGQSRYPQAFVDTERDDGDLTYFVLYKLDIIEQSLDRFAAHVRQEEERIQQSERLLRRTPGLNLRQRLLLEHGLRHPDTLYTIRSHQGSYRISEKTARDDLALLAEKKLLVAGKREKQLVYRIAPGLRAKILKRGL